MPATVTRPGKAPREVKNLGWILRHWKEVTMVTVEHYGLQNERRVTFHLDDGGTYVTVFASAAVLQMWLDRPVFRGLDVDWTGGLFVIGTKEYREIRP